jgi:arginine decarboxylase
MFGALVDFAEQHEYSWHTPGHEGGAAFFKSAVGRLFWEFFGEQTFRSDLSISVGELGSLLDHSGPIGEAEREAARIFGADMTYFVTNGTSTSNRVLYQASVVEDDVVVCDRNAHKSIEQANTINHSIPVYMLPTRNRYGIIGPIPPSRMTADAVRQLIVECPLAPDDARPVLATVTNSTYDGLLYHVPTVDGTLGTHVDRLHYDEAWYGYAAFNPLYFQRHTMYPGERPTDGPTTFATQSTHKLLAALSQASYIHVRNGRNPVDHQRFNEAFMMHASTSPLYSIIASNDVAAKMMDGQSGRVLTQESIDEAVAFRQTVARIGRDLGADWFFRCWQPDTVLDASGQPIAFVDASPVVLGITPEAWLLRTDASWHGFDGLPDGFAMLDPIKVTVLTPGMGVDGQLEPTGIPACIVTAYLDQHASIQVEKTQDYSVLFLFSMGVTKGKWGTLIAALFAFKHDYDGNRPIKACLPELYAQDPDRYASMGLADLAQAMHEHMRATGQMDAMARAYAALPAPTLRNSDAYAHVVRGTVDQVKVDDIAGRTVAVGVVPYPPGIPLLMPGESAGEGDGHFIGYLKALQSFDRAFPEFAHDLHGVEHEDGDYVVLCVREEAAR